MGTSASTKKPFMSIFFFLIILIFSILCPTASQEIEVEDQHEFDYDRHGEKGPHRWGQLKPEWRLCKSGTMQSPIDLNSERVVVVSRLGRLNRDYNPSNATIKNRGHDMMLTWVGGAGTLTINRTHYVLQQAHWHSPSEHTINGRRFNLELHMVHESEDGKVAVVAILYKLGREDTFLASLRSYLEELTDETEEERAVGVVDPKRIKLGSRKYYRYMGSLTTPPCTQGVVWTVVKKVRTVSREQIRLLRVAVHDESGTNARPLQPTHHRPIRLFRPKTP